MAPSGSERLRAYPWTELPRISRDGARAARDARALFAGSPGEDSVARALAAVTASDVTVTVRRVSPSADLAGARRALHFRTADGAATLALEPEAGLVSSLLARLLKRPPPLTDPDAPLDPRVEGALAALVVETARRAGDGILLRAFRGDAGTAAALRIDCVVRLDRTPYAATLWVTPGRAASRLTAARLDRLGGLPLTLGLVAAVSSGSRADVVALAPGDVWMPGRWLGGAPGGRPGPFSCAFGLLALAAPNSERGVGVTHSEDDRFVVRGEVIALGADESEAPPRARAASGATMSDDAAKYPSGYRDDTLREIALDAPVVVRVEVASVTLAAREWAELSPGDVLATGVRLTPQVVLRVAGREVARGDLVDIDGEVGVTIRELVDPGNG